MKDMHLSWVSAALIAALGTTASAYTVSGTVKDDAGQAIANADVSLIKENKSAKTDQKGEFTIHEDEAVEPPPDAIAAPHTPGYININSGILSYSQSGNSPVNVKIFDLMGNEVFKQSLYGSGQVDLTSGVKAKGTYFAQVTTGSAKQAIRFTANGNYGATLDANGHALLKEVQPGETLRVVADGFDTLSVPLGTLDTTLNLTLTASAPAEETFKFGYALGNAPRKSKGCGKDPVLKGTKQYQCQKKTWDNPWPNANVDCSAQLFEINGREFYVTFPQNYDKNKPYKLLIANHCMGSSANHMATWISADRDHISPYYAQKAQDTEGNYIFVAPQGEGSGMWLKGEDDHKFIHQLLTHLEDNYCIDTTRVFATGFSFGAMFSNSLAWEMQERLRAVAVYAVASYNIWLPQPGNGPYSKKDLPIAWMAVHGKQDGMCDYKRARDEALVTILKNNGKADANGNFTDASAEKSQLKEYSNGQHVCYDFTTVDPRFPVKFCSHGADHQWSATDNGDNSKSWVPAEVHKFFEQF